MSQVRQIRDLNFKHCSLKMENQLAAQRKLCQGSGGHKMKNLIDKLISHFAPDWMSINKSGRKPAKYLMCPNLLLKTIYI